MVVSLTNQLDNGKKRMTENILNLTLEIIHLLTGEDYIVVRKTAGQYMTPTIHPYMSEVWHKTQKQFMESTGYPLTDEKSNDKKILDLTNKIIQLLTGEVPIRCQDVTVHLSMEEWEYVEGHKDLYKDIMMEHHQLFTSSEPLRNKNMLVRCPSPPQLQDCAERNLFIPLADQNQNEDVINIKAEVIDEEEMYLREDQQCKEDKIHVDVGFGDHTKLLDGHFIFPDYGAELNNISHNNFIENAIPTNVTSIYQARDLSSDLTNPMELSFDQSQIPKQNSGCRTGKIFTCSTFGRQYRTNSIQMRMHRNERLFACSECNKCFTRKWSLVEHRRTHTGEKPFSCLQCGKCFYRKSILVEHQKSHTGEKPYSCSQCRKCFIAKQHLERHQITHTGERPFSCSVCGRRFTRKWLLERHLRTHVEQNQFSC